MKPMRVEATGVRSRLSAEVRAGLTRVQKEIPSKYLYDEVGSALFEAIALLPEYGLSRAGTRLLSRYAEEILSFVDSPVVVAELGSGSAKRTRWLLEALSSRQRTTYCPIEISPAALDQCERELRQLDAVSIVGFEREYLDGLVEVAARRREGERLLVLFLGSTIGNFDRPAGEEFLRAIRGVLRKDDALLLATDLTKSVDDLILAYDDPAGVTAAFNKNLLARINRELGADFDLACFEHRALYRDTERRIEMHLLSGCAQRVSIPGADLEVGFQAGETIWTESCHKYDPDEIEGLAARSGYRLVGQWIDQEWPFAQNLLRAG